MTNGPRGRGTIASEEERLERERLTALQAQEPEPAPPPLPVEPPELGEDITRRLFPDRVGDAGLLDTLRGDLGADPLAFVLTIRNLLEPPGVLPPTADPAALLRQRQQDVSALLEGIAPQQGLEALILQEIGTLESSEELAQRVEAAFETVFSMTAAEVADLSEELPDVIFDRIDQVGPTPDSILILQSLGFDQQAITDRFIPQEQQQIDIPDFSKLGQFDRERAIEDWRTDALVTVGRIYGDLVPDGSFFNPFGSPEHRKAVADDPEGADRYFEAIRWVDAVQVWLKTQSGESVFNTIQTHIEDFLGMDILEAAGVPFSIVGAGLRGAFFPAAEGRPGTPFEQSLEDYDKLSLGEQLFWEAPLFIPGAITELMGLARGLQRVIRSGGKAAVAFEESPLFKLILDLGVEGAKVTDDLRDFHVAWRKAMQIVDETRRGRELGRLNRAFARAMDEALLAGGNEAILAQTLRDFTFFNAQRTSGAASATAEASATTTAAATTASENGAAIARQLPSFTPGGSAVPGQAETLAEIIRGVVAMAPEGPVGGVPPIGRPSPDTFEGRPIFDMSIEELQAAAESEAIREANVDVEILGEEGAARFDRLQRQLNSSNVERSNAAQVEIDKIEASLAPGQFDRLFGIGEEGASAEDIRGLITALSAVEFESEQAMGQSLRNVITQLPGTTDVSQMTRNQREAVAVLRHAGVLAKEQGFDTARVTDIAIKAAATQFEPADAEFMLQNITDILAGKVRITTPEPAVPAVEEFEDLFPPGGIAEPSPVVEPGTASTAFKEPIVTPEPPPPDAPWTGEVITGTPVLADIGFKEKFRPARFVLDKIGVRDVWEMAFPAEVFSAEELTAARRLVNGWRKATKKPERRGLMWEYLNNREKSVWDQLTFEEKRAAPAAREFLDAWADRNGLSAEERLTNYIPHLFEAEVLRSIREGKPLSLQMAKAISSEGTRELFNPFLEERLGKETGLIKDPWLAIDVYVERSLRTVYYQPILDRIEAYIPFAPPAAADYLRSYQDRLAGKPSKIDREINTTIRNLADFLQDKGVRWEWLRRALTEGNPAAMASYNFAGALYIAWLHKPTTAIRNASQSLLTIAEVGPVNFAGGVRLRFTEEGKAVLAESLVLRSREGVLPAGGMDTDFASAVLPATQKVALFGFTTVDKKLNVSQAVLAGYAEAKSLYPDAPREMWIARGDEVGADTQFLYTKVNAASWSQNVPGRMGAMLTTWTFNFMELVTKWAQARPSKVYTAYEATLPEPPADSHGIPPSKKNWSATRQSMLMYLLLYGLAYVIEDRTKFRATEYIGITSIKGLANLAGGEFAAAQYPGAVADVVAGAVTGDDRLMQEGINGLDPVDMVGIAGQLQSIADGDRDWLSLLFYLNGKDPKFEELKENWSKQIDAYNEIEGNTERLEARRANHLLDGRLFIIGQTKTLQTEAARVYVQNQVEEHNLDTSEIPGWEKVFPLDTTEDLDAFQLRVGNLEKLDINKPPDYFDTGSFRTEVNALVNRVGRFKVTNDGQALAVQLLEDQDTWVPYFNFDRSIPEGVGAARLYRRQFPTVEASLYFWGQIQSFLNPESADILLQMMEEFDIPPQAIPAFQQDPSKYDDILTPLHDLKVGTFELDTLEASYSNAASPNWIAADKTIEIDGVEVNLRTHTIAQLKDDNPEWVADNRRIEALQKDATEEIAESWVDRGRKVDEFSAGSPEASLAMVDDLDTYRWALDEGLLTDDGGLPDGDPRLAAGRQSAQWNIPVLRLDVKWREQDDLWDSYSDPDSANFIPADEVDKREQARALLLAGNDDYRQDRRRREAFQRDVPEDLIENYVGYYEEDAIGFRRERLLLEVEGLAEALELDKPTFVPHANFDDLREEWQGTFDTFADVAEDDKAVFLIRNRTFHLAKLEMDAYTLGFQPDLAPNYVKYYRLLAEGRPPKWLAQESYHEPIWTLQDNPEFWNTLKTLRRATDPDWGKDIDKRFGTTPSRKVYALLIGYYDRRGIKARDNYRHMLVEGGETGLETYLVNVLGRVPIGRKDIFVVEPDPFDAIIKDLQDILKGLN